MSPAEKPLSDDSIAWPSLPPAIRYLITRIAPLLVGPAAITIASVVLFRLQFSTSTLVDCDGYFHIKFSYLMSHGEGLIRELPWLWHTIHRDYYRDHHFLQHLLQIPFTFGDLRLGAKYSVWCFATLAFGAFYLAAALRGRIAAAILTVALLAGGNHFLSRMMMPRVAAMSLALLLVVIWLVASRRHRWLAVAMFAYVWLYDGFVLGIIAIAAMVLGELLVDGRLNGKAILWGLAGVAAGTIINPYFPYNLESFAFNLTRTVSDAQIAVQDTGFEWRPLDAYYLLRKFRATWIALGLGLILTALCRRPRRHTLGALLLAALTTVLIMKARRYSDVWPPMVFLFLAFAWADFWDDWQMRREAGSLRGDAPDPHRLRGRMPRWIATAALAGLIAIIPYNYRNSREMVQDSPDFDHFKGAADYLRAHATPKSVVFNTDWDDFPYLFFFDSDNYYVLGLDQLYMKRYDEALYQTWRRIRDGEVEHPSRLIRDLFGAEYVVVNLGDKTQRHFYKRAQADPDMQIDYRDEYCSVLRIISAGADSRRGGPQQAIHRSQIH